MEWIRVRGKSNYTVDIGENECIKVIHTTGNFTINHKRNMFSFTAAVDANAVTLPSGYGTIQTDTILGYVNGVPQPGYAGAGFFIFPGAGFDAGDEVTLTFFSSSGGTITHSGSGVMNLALNDGEVIVPGSSTVSLEKI